MLERKLERVESLQEMYKTELQQLKLQNSRSLVMTSNKMKELINMVIRIAKVDSTVLLQANQVARIDREIIHTNSSTRRGHLPGKLGAIPKICWSRNFSVMERAFTEPQGRQGSLFELAQGA